MSLINGLVVERQTPDGEVLCWNPTDTGFDVEKTLAAPRLDLKMVT